MDDMKVFYEGHGHQPGKSAAGQRSWGKFLGFMLVVLVMGCRFTEDDRADPGIPPSLVATLAPTPTDLVGLEGEPAADPLAFLQKPGSASLRVLSYNVNWDSIFPEGDGQNHEFRSANREQAFQRITRAVEPDIICLQEINPERDPQQVGEFISRILAPQGGQVWQAVGARDAVIVTRFDLVSEGYELAAPAFPAGLDQAGALVDLPEAFFGRWDLYLICVHFKSGGGSADILLRQGQADVIVSQVGDLLTPGGAVDLPSQTPFIILGDLNVYDTDPAQHLMTLLTGDIENEARYGPDLQPDWDGTSLADVLPSHNGEGGEYYTWRNDSDPFAPGALDRVLYSDSVLKIENAFVLDTTVLSDEVLAAAGLQAGDVLLEPGSGIFDHLPLIVDFSISPGL